MRLGVNVDHVATVRQARRGDLPDPVDAALACQRAGANSIVCHLREDRRHIQDRDVARLLKVLRLPVNLEMSIAEDVVKVALRLKPAQVTLVPERRQELTTEGGLDAAGLQRKLKSLVQRFRERHIVVSVFVDPQKRQLEASAGIGVRVVELHTGGYATARNPAARTKALQVLQQATKTARGLGLAVAAGHGLDYENVKPIVAIPRIDELNIGFSIISRALFVGMEQAVREMKALLKP